MLAKSTAAKSILRVALRNRLQDPSSVCRSLSESFAKVSSSSAGPHLHSDPLRGALELAAWPAEAQLERGR